ncbi:hypothetical protein [Geminocystis sp. NIES-3709]|uniref:hypothetical protein n=1 Tax=Geminocystis sp. NIES-3709 TaxID=1617448 RepID=UPI0005FCCA63|nr:hypothetical protein [Geminocystis sp. NIES-3709]BAQ64924.1 hypothetical protein GM3709_1689 [Geminocystis sp. NIES-3709]
MAKPIIYDFTIKITEGSLQGKSYQGFLSYDDGKLKGETTEILTVKDGLKVCLNFFNQIYDEKKDVDYPEFPQLIFQKGQLEILDFWAESPSRRLWWNRDGWDVTLKQRENSDLPLSCP